MIRNEINEMDLCLNSLNGASSRSQRRNRYPTKSSSLMDWNIRNKSGYVIPHGKNYFGFM